MPDVDAYTQAYRGPLELQRAQRDLEGAVSSFREQRREAERRSTSLMTQVSVGGIAFAWVLRGTERLPPALLMPVVLLAAALCSELAGQLWYWVRAGAPLSRAGQALLDDIPAAYDNVPTGRQDRLRAAQNDLMRDVGAVDGTRMWAIRIEVGLILAGWAALGVEAARAL